MTEKTYPNSGRVFKNTNKKTSNHPDWDGNGEIECAHCGKRNAFFINGWVKGPDRGGDPWHSFAFKHKQAPSRATDAHEERPTGRGTQNSTQTNTRRDNRDDDEIPF